MHAKWAVELKTLMFYQQTFFVKISEKKQWRLFSNQESKYNYFTNLYTKDVYMYYKLLSKIINYIFQCDHNPKTNFTTISIILNSISLHFTVTTVMHSAKL